MYYNRNKYTMSYKCLTLIIESVCNSTLFSFKKIETILKIKHINKKIKVLGNKVKTYAHSSL